MKKQKAPNVSGSLEKFRCREVEKLTPEALPVRAGNILVVALDTDRLTHLEMTLRDSDPTRSDVVLLAADAEPGADAVEPGAARELRPRHVALFSKAVHIAEEARKPIKLLSASSADATRMALEAAGGLRSSRVILDLPKGSTFEEEHDRAALSWEALPPSRRCMHVEMMSPDGKRSALKLGAEAPLVSRGDEALA